ncbi:MAG: COX15/CtaA family protein [Planctomycetota bacterium]|jgi:cytochrome c oxidase assembly protein subunit 15
MHRLALAAAFATFVLLSVGGVVTSRDAGMIFRDWPLSNGSVNPDGWLTHPDKRAEHGHRLLGATVGLLTVALAFVLHRREKRKGVRRLGYVAVFAVVAQGLLGGLRVTEDNGVLALVHGCTGQVFFALMVVLAYLTSKEATREPESGPETRGLLVVALTASLAILAQVVLGAELRHHNGPINAHLVGAAIVAMTVFFLLTVAMLRHGERAALRRPVLVLAGLLLVQVALGFQSAGVISNPALGNSYSLVQVLLPTAHQSVGALMFATSVVVCLRAYRRLAAPAAGKVGALA